MNLILLNEKARVTRASGRYNRANQFPGDLIKHTINNSSNNRRAQCN
jgi:hypothetical protein